MIVSHHHDHYLVFYSFVVAMSAGYVAINLMDSAKAHYAQRSYLWIMIAGISMGLGIWSAHFIGMLAFNIQGYAIYYDLIEMVLSIGVAIIASVISLWLISSMIYPPLVTYTWSAILTGLGISGMHYLGIWSMKVGVELIWDLWIVTVSILISVLLSFFSYFLAFHLRVRTFRSSFYKILGGIFFGLAVGFMHYTAMSAMSFEPMENFSLSGEGYIESHLLEVYVRIAVVFLIAISISGIIIDRNFREHEQRNNQLLEGIRLRDEFLSLSSHEIKTPLTVLNLNHQLLFKQLMENQLSKKELESYLNRHMLSMNKIIHVVESMIDASNISLGSIEIFPENFVLNELIEEVLAKSRYLAEDNGNELIFTANDKYLVFLDRLKMEQVIKHLIDNALHYAKGSVINIDLSKKSEEIILRIIDSGRGISLEDQEKIFKRYERGENTHDIRGLGLGLYIAEAMVNKHNGRIEVESILDLGTEFRIYLPSSIGVNS